MIARIYVVHEDNSEKDFELEISWIGSETNGLHVPIPKDLLKEAEDKAKEELQAGFD